jgi:hypothetical protein
MIGMTLTFMFLYALVFVFERKRREVDAFQIATAVIVPVVLAFIVGFGIGQVAPPILTAVSAAIVLLITTYLVLLQSSLTLWAWFKIVPETSAGRQVHLDAKRPKANPRAV